MTRRLRLVRRRIISLMDQRIGEEKAILKKTAESAYRRLRQGGKKP